MTPTLIKSHGIQYTPPDLARFLARVIWDELTQPNASLDILDPACGDGNLLEAIALTAPARHREKLNLFGYEMDEAAIEDARQRLMRLGVNSVTLVKADFLMLDGVGRQSGAQRELFGEPLLRQRFDVVIANPPYVRTQVLGAARAKKLAERFELSGRVDLYHAFAKAITAVLKPGGTLGLLTSNRFLTIRSGMALRRLLRTSFNLHSVFDLGDTKLFEAAVLPVIVVGTKKTSHQDTRPCRFGRVYELRQNDAVVAQELGSLLDAVRDEDVCGVVKMEAGTYCLERGVLAHGEHDYVWSLSNADSRLWMKTVENNQECLFEDVAKVRVGIKTTADEVFIRRDWSGIALEDGILRPLLTHADAGRWTATNPSGSARVLYPHIESSGKRRAIALRDFPMAAAYLRSHEDRLRKRTYVIESGRKWYEIWVPHQPHDWSLPKVVFPDISEHPRFFVDTSGALVSGECYWMVVNGDANPDWLYLLLAVANSSFASRFYDIAFHNKLYAGRRRFQTQYVRKFPLPCLTSSASQEIVRRAKAAVANGPDPTEEELLDELVWQAFGLSNRG
jgi:methylase of polypeptide subunit release factors